jgi:leucyl aminopeptidase (aminopeptidase T)
MSLSVCGKDQHPEGKGDEGGDMRSERAFWYEMVDTGTKYGRIGRLMKTANTIMEDCLGIKPGETVTIVTDTEISPLIYHVLAGSVSALGGIPIIVIMDPLPYPNAEPPEAVAAAMRESDVFVNVCSRTISHTKARYEAQFKHKRRYLIMPAATEDMLTKGAATADYKRVKELGFKVIDILSRGKEVRVVSDYGTDVTFSIEGRPPKPVFEAREPNSVAIFPGGETPLCPVEDTASGTIVIEHFILDIGILNEPVTWTVRNGRVVEITGGREAEELKRFLEKHGDENSLYIGEFSIGINPAARAIGSNLEDKQIYGSVHIAIGSGVQYPPHYSAKYHSKTHIDGVMLKPSVWIDGKLLVNRGEIVIVS